MGAGGDPVPSDACPPVLSIMGGRPSLGVPSPSSPGDPSLRPLGLKGGRMLVCCAPALLPGVKPVAPELAPADGSVGMLRVGVEEPAPSAPMVETSVGEEGEARPSVGWGLRGLRRAQHLEQRQPRRGEVQLSCVVQGGIVILWAWQGALAVAVVHGWHATTTLPCQRLAVQPCMQLRCKHLCCLASTCLGLQTTNPAPWVPHPPSVSMSFLSLQVTHPM